MSKRAPPSDFDEYEQGSHLTSSDDGSDGYIPSSGKSKKSKKPRIKKEGSAAVGSLFGPMYPS